MKQYLNFVDNIGQGVVNNDNLNCVGSCACSECNKTENFVDNVLGATPEVFKQTPAVVKESVSVQQPFDGASHKQFCNNMMIITCSLFAASLIVLLFKRKN